MSFVCVNFKTDVLSIRVFLLVVIPIYAKVPLIR